MHGACPARRDALLGCVHGLTGIYNGDTGQIEAGLRFKNEKVFEPHSISAKSRLYLWSIMKVY